MFGFSFYYADIEQHIRRFFEKQRLLRKRALRGQDLCFLFFYLLMPFILLIFNLLVPLTSECVHVNINSVLYRFVIFLIFVLN